jgi:hypothetical protein
MTVEVTAALIAGLVSLIGILVSYIVTHQTIKLQCEMQSLEQKASEERLQQELNAKRLEWEPTIQSQHAMQLLEQQAAEERLRRELDAKRLEWESSLRSQEQQWQVSFREELRRNLVQESTLEVTRQRIKLYGEIWRMLKVTSQYEWRHQPDLKTSVKYLVEQLSDAAYNETGMVMSDRSLRLLNNLRNGCADFLRGETADQEIIDRAHMLKHSLRSDLGIIDYEYESDLLAVAASMGKVDNWEKHPA